MCGASLVLSRRARDMVLDSAKWILGQVRAVFDRGEGPKTEIPMAKRAEYRLRKSLYMHWRQDLGFELESDYTQLLRELLGCGFLEGGKVAFPLVALTALALPGGRAAFPLPVESVLDRSESESRQMYVCRTYAEVVDFVVLLADHSRIFGYVEEGESLATQRKLRSLSSAARVRLETGSICRPPDLEQAMAGWAALVHFYLQCPARSHLLSCVGSLPVSGPGQLLRCPHGPEVHPKLTPTLLRDLLGLELWLCPETSPSALLNSTARDYKQGRWTKGPEGSSAYRWYARVDYPHRYERPTVGPDLAHALNVYLVCARPLLVEKLSSADQPLFPVGGGKQMVGLFPLAKLAVKLSGFSPAGVSYSQRPPDLAERMKAAHLRQRADIRRLFL